MRVLQVHTRYRQPGGEDSVVESERHILTSAGHRVELIEFENPGRVGSSLRAMALAPANPRAASQVVEVARGFEADVVHVHNTWFALSPAVFHALSDAGFPTVMTIHNYRFTCVNALLYRDGEVCELCVGEAIPWHGVRHACYRGSRPQSAVVALTIATQKLRRTWHQAVDVVIALSDFAADLMVRSGIPRDRIVVKPNAVADPGPRWAPPSTSDIVLFASRLTEEKGSLDLVHAWSKADTGALRLVVAGDGPLRADLEATAGSNVEVLGRVPPGEVASLMSRSRAVVIPSRWYEGQPMTLIEAMAHGTPAIVANHGALPETAGGGGWPHQPGDTHDLARVLSLLDTGAVDEKGQSARRRYEERFSAYASGQGLQSAYESALRRRGRRA